MHPLISYATYSALILQLPLWAYATASSSPTLPGGWTPYACWTDSTSSRILTINSGLPPNTMTPEVCVEYCAANNWSWAGVEYGGECWCDALLHQTDGHQLVTDPSACNMPCNGDLTQTCGGSNLIYIYFNVLQLDDPYNPRELGFWEYSGCFTDDPSHRTLLTQVQTIGGVTPASCADACEFYGYTTAGVEYGQECWCGNSTGSATQVPDNECEMTCNANRQFYCGDANRLNIYQHIPGPQTTYINECSPNTGFNTSHFSFMTIPKEPPKSSSDWNGAILRVVDILTVENTTWSLLSACQSCDISWWSLSFGTDITGPNFLIPSYTFLDPLPAPMISIDLTRGESVIFQTQATLPSGYTGYAGYCAAPNPYPPETPNIPSNGPILLGGGHADDWAICPNSSAFPVDRLDLIFQPSADHPNYNLEECIPVDLFFE